MLMSPPEVELGAAGRLRSEPAVAPGEDASLELADEAGEHAGDPGSLEWAVEAVLKGSQHRKQKKNPTQQAE